MVVLIQKIGLILLVIKKNLKIISQEINNQNMERRVVIKNLAMSMGALVSLPAWAKGWKEAGLPNQNILVANQAKLLQDIVETIIPKTDIPGAAALGVDRFVLTMVTDCYDAKTQENFKRGVAKVDTESNSKFGKSFAALKQSDKLKVLEGFQNSTDGVDKEFLGLVKNHTIQGFMSSEYVMTNITHYELIPARYHGCVPIK